MGLAEALKKHDFDITKSVYSEEVTYLIAQLVDAMFNSKVAVIKGSISRLLPRALDGGFADWFDYTVRKLYQKNKRIMRALNDTHIVIQFDMANNSNRVAFKPFDQAVVAKLDTVTIHRYIPGYNMGVCLGWFNNGEH